MLSKNIRFKNFSNKSNNLSIYRSFNKLKKDYFKKKIKILLSLSKNYKYNYSKRIVLKYKKFQNFKIIGMGGSILGAKAIYQFLNHKIKKKVEIMIFLGSLYNFRGRYEDAVDCYKRALSINSKFSAAHFNLGTVFITTGKFIEAKKHLLESIKLNPNFIQAHRTLSRITKYTDNDEHFKVLKKLEIVFLE